jgi:4-hydroxybenzoate polyprenyltransferase
VPKTLDEAKLRGSQGQPDLPLIVDLDGTLIRTDLLVECLYQLVKDRPILLFALPFWLLRGKAYFKKQVASRVPVDPSLLPYNEAFLQYLRGEFERGRTLILATASFRTAATRVSTYLGLFSEVLATDETINLSGRHKLRRILEIYPERGFDYAGNARPDLHVFASARNAILVDPEPGVLAATRKLAPVQHLFQGPAAGFKVYFKAIRAYQWVKNILLFVPLLTAHQWTNLSLVERDIFGFLAFSLCASGGYLFNDLLDLPSDRNHPRKRHRPLASGQLSILTGSVLMVLLPLAGLIIAGVLAPMFGVMVLLYLMLSVAYTVHLKGYVLIDVLVLATLYTLRIIAGAEAVHVRLSFWLLAFSVFLFFSLALIKRTSELRLISENGSAAAKGRDYNVSDLSCLRDMGIASGYLTIPVVALYVNSPEVVALYTRPQFLWLTCIGLFYWISRLWLKTGRGEMTDDPIVFALKDSGSRYVALAMALVIGCAL